MIAWMLYTLLVGPCIVAAALAADWLMRLVRRPVRSVWIGAAALCVLLPVAAPLRARAAASAAGESVDVSSLVLVQSGMRTVERHMTPSAGSYALAIWVVATVFVAVIFITAVVRLRRARAAWPEIVLLGHRVFVSPSFGPIVVGFGRPHVVVPRWVLDRSAEEQRLILEHEVAHVRARDPVVLGIAAALVVLMPWNPALWMILSRIRLAIEIDCDSRVLRSGASAHRYGSLLVDVAERTSALRVAAIALADRPSHLHQRILAMRSRQISHPVVRGVTMALAGATALLAACEAKMPTAAEIDHMDAASAERSARQLTFTGDSIVWLVDGKPASEAEAKSIPRDSIVDVYVNSLGSGPLRLNVATTHTPRVGIATTSTTFEAERREPAIVDNKVNSVAALQGAITKEQPLLLIDGVRSDVATFKAIDPKRIESVEVLKGRAAVQEYGDDAKRGVIVVTTKASGRR